MASLSQHSLHLSEGQNLINTILLLLAVALLAHWQKLWTGPANTHCARATGWCRAEGKWGNRGCYSLPVCNDLKCVGRPVLAHRKWVLYWQLAEAPVVLPGLGSLFWVSI